MFESKIINISQEKVDEYCRCVNDWNPIHRPEYATPTVPGMLTTALIFENPDAFWRLAKMEVRYSAPVYIGKETLYEYRVINDKLRFRKYQVLVKQGDVICLEADCLLVRKE